MVSTFDAYSLNELVMDVVEETRAPYGSPQTTGGFRELRVWQVGLELVTSAYEVTATFPPHEQFGLGAQMRRATTSVVLNIAEGWGRDGNKEFARFVDMAMGSLCETEACVEVALRLGYVTNNSMETQLALTERLGRMLHKLRTHLRS